MLKFLFVDDQLDDDSSSASIAARKLEEIGGYSIIRAGFSDAKQKINDIVPDLIILDLQEVTASGDRSFTGTSTCEWIWENHFCPIVVYSAFPDQLSDTHRNHPFVEVVTKGRKGVESLEESITRLRPHIESIREAEKSIRKEFSVAMREVAPYAYEIFKDNPAQRNDAILRSSRRRLAAFMDGLSKNGTRLASWEQYLCPPVCDDLQLGDILQDTGVQSNDPTSYRIVLSPSCDLVVTGGRKSKIENILVARCCSMKDALSSVNMTLTRKTLNNTKSLNVYKDKLKSTILTQGYYKTVLPFPQLDERIPTMAANLRDLDFVQIADIGKSENRFRRIASIDSPFRELVAWAYMQIACRPGLPDRNYDAWCDGIIDRIKQELI